MKSLITEQKTSVIKLLLMIAGGKFSWQEFLYIQYYVLYSLHNNLSFPWPLDTY